MPGASGGRRAARASATACLVLGGVALVGALWAFATPSQRQVQSSSFIDVTAAYSYQATVRPDALFPHGGATPLDSTVFPAITKGLTVRLQPSAAASAPMTIALHMAPTVYVDAQGLWSEETALGGPQTLQGRLPGLKLPSAAWPVDVPGISQHITAVGKAIQADASDYTVVVDPHLTGTVGSGNATEALNWDPTLTFQVGNGTWQVKGPLTRTHEVRFASSTSVPVRMLGGLAPQVVRDVSGLAAVALLLVGALLLRRGRPERRELSEWERIDRRYRSRIIPLTLHLPGLRREILRLPSFPDLLRLADERELPILRAESAGAVEYLIVEGDIAYGVRCPKTQAEPHRAAPLESEDKPSPDTAREM